MNKYRIAANLDIGCDRENQEDFVQFKELDDDNLFCVIADGTGSREGHPHPASIAAMEIIKNVEAYYNEIPGQFFEDPAAFLKFAMMHANSVLGYFKMGNEELFSGYAASVTCCLLSQDRHIYIAHAGNTRLYVIRNGKIQQITRDHTKAAELYYDKKISEETYHVHPDRLVLTSGIGVMPEPAIQTFSGSIQVKDLLLMTTDGIHYAIKKEFLAQIILSAQTEEAAVADLVEAAKDIIKYPDNMCAVVIYDTDALRRQEVR